MSIQATTYSQNNAGEVRTAGYIPGIPATKNSNKAQNASFSRALEEASPLNASTNAQSLTSLSASQSTAAPSQDPQNGEEGGGFIAFLKGVLDVINPLQHIPVVGAIYRHITGDEISPMARIAGDCIFGGAIGGAIAMADVVFEKATGNDVGETMIAMVTGGDDQESADGTMLASNLNNIQPAAGAISARDIIWNTPAQDSVQLAFNDTAQNSLSHTPSLPYSAGTNENDPATSTPYSTPGQHSGGKATDLSRLTAATGNTGPVRITVAPKAGSGIASLTQEAPAAQARMARLPEPIAPSILQAYNVTAEVKEDSSLTQDEQSLDIVQAVPKELVAYKMAEALDKYGAMKRGNM